jgi:formylmethanofuran dehydrogenase subunit E
VFVDVDIPYADIIGGWHKCNKCGEEKYIHWGSEYKRLLSSGNIKE